MVLEAVRTPSSTGTLVIVELCTATILVVPPNQVVAEMQCMFQTPKADRKSQAPSAHKNETKETCQRSHAVVTS